MGVFYFILLNQKQWEWFILQKHSSRKVKSTVSYLIYEHDGKDGLIEAFGYPVMDTVKGK